jgi:choline dehydrogenase-like flavoprotein
MNDVERIFAEKNGALVQGKDVSGPTTLDCDVVVIGSGAGGGTVAYELCEAGLDVLVLEEGGYHRTEDFSTSGPESIKSLYRDAGTNIIFGKPDILFTEGKGVGGSTVINGGICWRTPDRILERWCREHGLPADRYGPEAMAPLFDRVEKILHVAPQSDESIGEDCRRIQRGALALGWKHVPVHRNQRECMGTNNCIFGCPSGAKQSTLVSYLPRAVAKGARIHADAKVTRIRTDRAGRGNGVEGFVHNPYTGEKHALTVNARAVMVCGGAIQSPVLLQGSRLGNRWVGRNLLVHPNVKAVAIYDEEIVGWKGTIQGWQVHEYLEEGILMTTTFVPPAMLAMSLPFIGRESMAVMEALNRMVVGGVLVDDTVSGRVRRGPGGAALMSYRLTAEDLVRMRRGLALISELYFASGASRVLLPIDSLPAIDSADEIPRILDHPFKPTELEVLTVHAMGTARLSASPKQGACDPSGQLHGHPGVYVADASIFPTCVGVNPQVSIMALATRIAEGAAETLLARRPKGETVARPTGDVAA